MAGIEENLAVIGDWNPPDPSPRTFFPSFLSDDFSSRSFSNLPMEKGNEVQSLEVEEPKVLSSEVKDGDVGMEFSDDSILELRNAFSVPQIGSQGGLAQRMAARARFTAPTLDTAQIRSVSLASSFADVRSPYLTVPPGLSPTTLLDSPVFLSNSLAQPSPTTGKFLFGQSNMMNSASGSSISDKNKENMFADIDNKAFVFKPNLGSSSSYFPNAANHIASSNNHQPSLPGTKVSPQPEFSSHAGSLDSGAVHLQNNPDVRLQSGFSELSDRKDTAGDFTFNQKQSDSVMANENSPPLEDPQDEEGEPKAESSSIAVGAPSEDGFNWRKYGQKQVKGSEYPRSYYKCTHPNCQVKKKVERSHEGHITEIIYKGAHNHPKPLPNRRSGITSSQLFSAMQIDGAEPHAPPANLDGKPTWASTQNGTGGTNWTNDGLEATSSASVATELCDLPSSMQTQDVPRFESTDAIDVSSTLSNDEDEDDQATIGSVSLGCDGEGDESESKRRKLEASTMEMNAAARAVREPRVVVQTTSEVDILDDGYRWRKYGQKVVKGNPNPRSYYKCTNPGCSVRKHVERASHDLKSVITTYEGKHNHDVPVARNSSHSTSGPSSVTATSSAPQAHSNHRRPEPSQIQDNLPRFDGPLPLGAFALSGRDQLGRPTGFSFGMGHQSLTNLAMSGLGPAASQMNMLPPVHHSYVGPRRVNEAGIVIPKGEPKEEQMPEPGFPMQNPSSVYHQIMSRLPLGPQM